MKNDWRKPGKRPYNETAEKVVAAFDKHRDWSSTKLGEFLGLHPAYVRKALQRNGRKLARSLSR